MGEKGVEYMKTDALGEYNEFEVPRDFALPLNVNQEHNAIANSNGELFAFYGVIREEVPRVLAKRKCEFMVKLANGELIMSKGRVYKKVGEQYQKDRLVVTYDEVRELAVK